MKYPVPTHSFSCILLQYEFITPFSYFQAKPTKALFSSLIETLVLKVRLKFVKL